MRTIVFNLSNDGLLQNTCAFDSLSQSLAKANLDESEARVALNKFDHIYFDFNKSIVITTSQLNQSPLPNFYGHVTALNLYIILKSIHIPVYF